MAIDRLPAGWEVWTEQPANFILVFRPDVFDSSEFPAQCLPTLYVTRGQRSRRPGRRDPDPDDPWHVTLYLEPDVEIRSRTFDDRNAAEAGAVDLADAFARGAIDFRSAYQQPRAEYLDRLETLTGRS